MTGDETPPADAGAGTDGSDDPDAAAGTGDREGPDAVAGDREASPGPPPATDRLTAVSLADGRLVIYDRETTDAWLQSNYTVDVEGHA